MAAFSPRMFWSIIHTTGKADIKEAIKALLPDEDLSFLHHRIRYLSEKARISAETQRNTRRRGNRKKSSENEETQETDSAGKKSPEPTNEADNQSKGDENSDGAQENTDSESFYDIVYECKRNRRLERFHGVYVAILSKVIDKLPIDSQELSAISAVSEGKVSTAGELAGFLDGEDFNSSLDENVMSKINSENKDTVSVERCQEWIDSAQDFIVQEVMSLLVGSEVLLKVVLVKGFHY